MSEQHQPKQEFSNIENMIGDQEISRWEKKAEAYVNNPQKTNELLQSAFRKANDNRHIDPVNKIWERVQLLFSLIKDWVDGQYRQVSKKSILMILAGILYFVSPLDLVPDWIFGLGLLDDATVLAFIINRLDKEIGLYKTWKNNKMI